MTLLSNNTTAVFPSQ